MKWYKVKMPDNKCWLLCIVKLALYITAEQITKQSIP